MGEFHSIRWVRLAKYCELTGDTAAGVHKRRGAGVWLDGVHCRLGPDGKVWVNLEKAQQWVEGSASVPTAAAARRSA